MNQQLKDKIEEIKDKFIDRCSDIIWRRKGVFFSEALAFCAYCELYNIKTIIESGVRNGVSTEIWVKYFGSSVDIYCVDLGIYKEDVDEARSIFEQYENIYYYNGDGNVIVPALSNNTFTVKNTALFLDGPKEYGAIDIIFKSFVNKVIKFAAIHDMGAGALMYSSKPTTKPSIKLMRKLPQYEFCTDDSEFISDYWYVNDKLGGKDNEIWEEYKRRYYIGCGLSFLVNK